MNEQERLKQIIIDQIEKEDAEKRDRFGRILRMANDHTPDELIVMMGQSMFPGMPQDYSLELLFSYTISFAIKMEKEIEGIKQCLKTKKDIPSYERPVTMSIFRKEGQEDE